MADPPRVGATFGVARHLRLAAALAAWLAVPVLAIAALLPLAEPGTTARFALAVSAALLVAVAFYPALALDRRARTAALVAAIAAIGATPLLVSAAAPLARAVAAIYAAAFAMKLYDVHVGAARGIRPDAWAYLFFLPNFFTVVQRKLHREPRPEPARALRSLGHALLELTVGLSITSVAARTEWSGQPFLVEHTAKALGIGLVFFGVIGALVQLARLAGGSARDFTDAPLLARTPAEFWRRYNRTIYQFLYEDVFKPAVGESRSPMAATLLVFAVSGLLHEYIFSLAIGRVQGYQTAFFLLNGCAVAATLRLRPKGWWAVPAVAATLAFVLLSSVLFFASFHSVTTFYVLELPAPLAGW